MIITRFAVTTGLMITLLAVSGCSTPSVRADADSKVNIADYHSYVWEQTGDDATNGGLAFKNPLNQKRLRAAVAANLANHGFQPSPEGGMPDSYVTVAIGTRQNIEIDDRFPAHFGLGWGWGGWRPGMMGSVNWGSDGLYNYREGRVSIDLYDAKTREPIWHASVEQDLSYLTGANAEARINAVVAAMFTKFPGVTTK